MDIYIGLELKNLKFGPAKVSLPGVLLILGQVLPVTSLILINMDVLKTIIMNLMNSMNL